MVWSSFPRVALRLPWASIVVPLQGTSASAAHYAGNPNPEGIAQFPARGQRSATPGAKPPPTHVYPEGVIQFVARGQRSATPGAESPPTHVYPEGIAQFVARGQRSATPGDKPPPAHVYPEGVAQFSARGQRSATPGTESPPPPSCFPAARRGSLSFLIRPQNTGAAPWPTKG